MIKNIFLYIAGGISVLIFFGALIIPQVLFYNHLHQYGWSADPARLGQYGDFIGGITNPLLSAISIVVLVYLTITVHNNEKKRHEEADANEEKRNQMNLNTQKIILLTQMRSNVVNELEKEMLVFTDEMETVKMVQQLHKMKAILMFFITHNNELFNNSINDPKTVFHGIYKRLVQSIDNIIFGIEHDHVELETIEKEYEEFFGLRTQYIAKLNRFIIDQMSATN